MATKHIELSTLADAQELAARLDSRLGLPKAAPGAIGEAARAWIAGGRQGDPPSRGITVTWCAPYELEGGGWGLVVANASADPLNSRGPIPSALRAPLPSGRVLSAEDIIEDTPPRRLVEE